MDFIENGKYKIVFIDKIVEQQVCRILQRDGVTNP